MLQAGPTVLKNCAASVKQSELAVHSVLAISTLQCLKVLHKTCTLRVSDAGCTAKAAQLRQA